MGLKTISLAFLTGIFMMGCQAQSTTSYTLSGEIKGLADGDTLELIPVSHIDDKVIAETTVAKGKFTFTGSTDEPLAVYLKAKDGYGSKAIMLSNGTSIKVEGTVEAKESGENKSYDFSKVTVTGSPLTDKYLELLSAREKLNAMFEAKNKAHADISAAVGAARMAKDKAKMDSLSKTDAYKAMSEAENNFFKAVETTYKDVVMANKDTFWGPLMMISFTTYLSGDMKSWYDELSEDAKESYYGKQVQEELFPAGKEGTTVSEFLVKDKDGKQYTLANLSQGKKYILIDFWASWCNPCRKEIPNLKKLYAEYSAKGFEIVSISIDKKEADWLKALQEEKLTWPNFRDTEGVADLYKVKFVPTMYLVNEKGVMVGENLRGDALADKLAELFGK